GGTKMAMDKRVGRTQKVRCGHGVRLVLRIMCRRSRALMYRLTRSRPAEYHAHLLFSKGCARASGLAFGLRVTYECGQSSRMLKNSASVVLASLRGSTYRSVHLASSLAEALLDGLFEHPGRRSLLVP